MSNNESKSFVDHLLIIAKWRKFIYKVVFYCCLLALIITFIIRPKYTATTSIMPPNPEQEMMFGLLNSGMSSTLSRLSQLGGIAGMSTPSDLYAALINSDRIRGEIIKRYDLKKIFKTKTMYDTYKQLNEMIKTSVSPVGIISVSVTYFNRQLAADIANSLIEELNKFNTETAMTLGRRYRIFIENRLKETTDSLKVAEETLKNFQEKNRTIALNEEIKVAIETIAKLKSEQMIRQIQKGAWASVVQDNNPYLNNINRELSELDKQISNIESGLNLGNKNFGAGFSMSMTKLPSVSLEYARLARDAAVQSNIFGLLTQQFEQAKIMELKDTPTVQILDYAQVPEKKSSPKRMRILILVAVFSLIFSICFGYVSENLSYIKQTSPDYAKWISIARNFKSDAKAVISRIINLFRKKQ